MSELSNNIILVILVTSFATYLSRFLGVVSSEKISETSKIFKWFNCIAYSTLAALIARMVVFPAGVLEEADLLFRLLVIIGGIILYLFTKKNLVYPTVLSAIILALLVSWGVIGKIICFKSAVKLFLIFFINLVKLTFSKAVLRGSANVRFN